MLGLYIQSLLWMAATILNILVPLAVWIARDWITALVVFFVIRVVAGLLEPTPDEKRDLELFAEQRMERAKERASMAEWEAEQASRAKASAPAALPGKQDSKAERVAWDELEHIELRVGEIVSAEPLKQARKPAYKLLIDFGYPIGRRWASAQLTGLYTPEGLVGKRVVAVTNLPEKQVGPVRVQCMVTGFHDSRGNLSLCTPDHEVPLGTRMT